MALVLDESKLHLRIRRIWNIISLQIAIKISITTNHQLNFARVFDQCTTGHLGWQNNWLLTVTLHSSYNALWWIKYCISLKECRNKLILRTSTHKVKPIKTQYGLAAFLELSNSYTQNFNIKRQAVVLSLFNHQQTQTKEHSNIRSNWRSHVDVTSEESLRSGLCSWKTILFYELCWNCILTAVKSF